MKTRVTESYDKRLGIYLYSVWKWDLWDAPDLREMYPDKYDWRHVIELPDKNRCIDIAQKLAYPEQQHDPVPMVELYAGYDMARWVPLVVEFDPPNVTRGPKD